MYLILILIACLAAATAARGQQIIPLPYTLPDGTRLTGYLSLPPTYREGHRYPAILLIHGWRGVNRQHPQGLASSWLKMPLHQQYLCRQYVVFSAEYYADYLGDPREFASLAAALQTLVQLPSVDPTRLVALGASHGGYLSLMTLMHPAIQPKPTAGVSISGVVDVASWVSYLRSVPKTINLLPGLHHYAFQTIPRTLGWPPDKDSRIRERFARISVLTYVKNLQAPLLLIHGARDIHVPPNQAQMLIVALQLEQKNYEAVTAANQGTDDHFLFQHNSEVWRKIADFLERTLAPDTPAVSNQ